MGSTNRDLSFACLALLVSCGGVADDPRDRVVHLDPRLADGSPSTVALVRPPVLVKAFAVESADTAAAALAPWRLRNLGLVEGGNGGGVVFRAAGYDLARGITNAYLEFGDVIDASEFNRVELELYSYNAGSAALAWGAAPNAAGQRRSANTNEKSWETLSFSMVGDDAWRGEVRGLRLLPCASGPQIYELREVRFLREDFQLGAQPSSAHGAQDADAGLLGPGGDKRRSWPSDDGVVLFDACRVPADGRLSVSVNLSGRARAEQRAANFAVDVREAEGEWHELVHISPHPASEWQDLQWRELSADMSAWSQREVELRFRTWFGANPRADGELTRGEFLWAAPLVHAPRARDSRPNLILVTLDTLRADAVGAYGDSQDTPFFDELAARGLLFEDAWTACNSTLPSHTTMLTGLPVPSHGVLDNVSTLAPEVRTLAQSLHERGYTTAAAVSVEHLQPGWSGLGRGFDRYHEVIPGASVDGAKTLAAVYDWLEDLSDERERPLFLWVHLFDPHTPYGPPQSFLEQYEQRVVKRGGVLPARTLEVSDIGRTTATAPGGFLEGVSNQAYARHLYAANVAYTDALLRNFVRVLDECRLASRSALLVTSDHGESLGEHDVWYGHQRLHPETTRVPLVLELPSDPAISIGGGRKARDLRGVVQTRASTVDIAKTFLNLAGGGELDALGEDLLELVNYDEGHDRRVWFVHASGEQAGCRDDTAHYWNNLLEFEQLGPDRREAAGRDALFLLSTDPLARNDIALEQPDLCGRYNAKLQSWLTTVVGGRTLSAEIDPAQAARLKALGYTGGD